MTAALRALLVTALVFGSAGMARAADPWAALAQRIAATDPRADLAVTLGAEPRGFVFPLPARPALPVLGSLSLARNGAAPVLAHIYYTPTSHTGTAWEALLGALTAAGYTQLRDRDDSLSPFDPAQRVQRWCPPDLRRPSIDVGFDRIDGLPAMDIEVQDHADATACRDAVTAPIAKAHEPVLAGIPGIELHGRMMQPGILDRGLMPFATATVQTSLAPKIAVEKMAERYVAKGWIAEPAAIGEDTTTQRFTLSTPVRRLTALLVLDRRAPNLYALMIAMTDAPLDAP
jgi:hypothetical protein